ncbi:MAG: RIP metalloprotease RseP [Peptostreptococcales bacterium]|jgi:regulator of sigma E protease
MGLTIIAAIFIFGILIFVHEAGHFMAAKAVGIRVNKFAIGMGPVIFKKQKGETEYSLRAFPMGGFVKMEGEDEDSDDARSFEKKSTFQKVLVLIAGSAMNFIFAIILVIFLFAYTGFPSNENVIGEIVPGNPAEQAGIMAGDRVLEINSVEITSWDAVLENVSESDGRPLTFKIDRDGEVFNIEVESISEQGRQVVGIIPSRERSLLKSVKEGVGATFELMGMMLQFLGSILRGQASTNDVMGPVGIISAVGDVAKLGFIYLVNFTAMISLNLAVINMIPFPALDGGRLILTIIQGITGKKINPDMEGIIHFIGFAILIGVMILVTYKDIGRLFQ